MLNRRDAETRRRDLRSLFLRFSASLRFADGAPALAAARSQAGVRGAFTQGIEAGKAARLSRTTIDGLYRKAWNGHTQTESEESK